jgi:dihydropteroate synthase
VEHGATVVNDVTAMRDPEMPGVVAKHRACVILMHIRGEPQTMQAHADYDDVVDAVRAALAAAVQRGVASGIARDKLWIDPGLGFAKDTQHNLQLTRRMGEFGELRCPIVYGPSRKAFLGKLTGKPPKERDQATAAACVAAVLAGAHVLRVHNVAAVNDALRVAAAIRDAH